MNKKYKLKLGNKIHFILLLLFGFVFFFLLGENGPIISDDSGSFLNPSPGLLVSYWLYPTFLRICKIIFGEHFFLQAVYAIQGILAIATSVILAEFFRKEYKLNYAAAFIMYLLSFLPYGYSLPENVVSHHILTEGLAFPLFSLYMLFVLKMYLYEKKTYVCMALFLSVLLVLLRPQLLVMPFVVIAILTWKMLQRIYYKLNDQNRKKFIFTCVCTICVIGVGVAGLCYSIFRQGKSSQLSAAIAGRVFCVMGYEDRELFEGETKEVFDAVYQHADENGNLLKYIPKDFKRSENIAYIINENTKDGLAVIAEYCEEHSMSDKKLYRYDLWGDIIYKLFEVHWMECLTLTIQLLPFSLVASIFIQPDAIYGLCHVIAYSLYVFAVVVMILAGKIFLCDKKALIPMCVTLFILSVNVLATNIVFYGQQRYVIYTFGMFYISGLILLIEIYRKWKEKQDSKNE